MVELFRFLEFLSLLCSRGRYCSFWSAILTCCKPPKLWLPCDCSVVTVLKVFYLNLSFNLVLPHAELELDAFLFTSPLNLLWDWFKLLICEFEYVFDCCCCWSSTPLLISCSFWVELLDLSRTMCYDYKIGLLDSAPWLLWLDVFYIWMDKIFFCYLIGLDSLMKPGSLNVNLFAYAAFSCLLSTVLLSLFFSNWSSIVLMFYSICSFTISWLFFLFVTLSESWRLICLRLGCSCLMLLKFLC